MTDRISALYADVKPEPYRPVWPTKSDEDRARSRELGRRLATMPSYLRGAGAAGDPTYGPIVRELLEMQRTYGARVRDAGIPRHVLAAMTNPATGKPPTSRLDGWDERDAALKFWKKAYCA